MSPAAHRPELSTTSSKASATPAGGKRKREHTTHIPADSPNNQLQEEKDSAPLHQLLKDAVEILKRSVTGLHAPDEGSVLAFADEAST